ncbi:hypothetical protein GCM10022393_18880 [Aquimarina addita]|uniref:Lipoprotein n=1 Tax=Aquimarina addita TaxID=870485 RepID=A0ABP6UL96_9FLAO
MIKNIFLLFGLFMVSCHINPDYSSNISPDFVSIAPPDTEMMKFPYQVFFESLKMDQLTDTILVQSRVRVFGCGTAAIQYAENLRKSNLQKFYDQYGNILSDKKWVSRFEKNNNLKIIWVSRGNEGELLQLEDEKLHINHSLEERLLSEKCFVKFIEEPSSLKKLQIKMTVAFPQKEKALYTVHSLSKQKGIWSIDAIDKEEWSGHNFKRAYYP